MTTYARSVMTSASLFVLALGASSARAAETCSAYPTGTADRIESTDLTAKFGEVPKPSKELRFAYVTKTLINEFWQDVAAGVKSEAAKYGIKVDVQAAKDESSMVEQLNLAQTVASQKPDALLLSPQSDSNLAPVIKAAKAANIPTVIIDDARTAGASSYIGTDQVKIGAQAATFLHEMNPKGGDVAQIEGAAGSPNARARIKGFKEQLAAYPDLKLVASQPGNWDRLTPLNATSDILRQHPDLAGVYANNDGMALGVFEAVKKANLVGKTSRRGHRRNSRGQEVGRKRRDERDGRRIPVRGRQAWRGSGAAAHRLPADSAMGGVAERRGHQGQRRQVPQSSLELRSLVHERCRIDGGDEPDASAHACNARRLKEFRPRTRAERRGSHGPKRRGPRAARRERRGQVDF